MVFNLYLNAARPHARRRFDCDRLRQISPAYHLDRREYVSYPAVLRTKCLFIIALIIASLQRRRRAMKLKFGKEVYFIAGPANQSKEASVYELLDK